MKWYLADGLSAQQKKRPASGDVFIGDTPEEAVAGAIAEFDRQIAVLERLKKLVAAEIKWQAAPNDDERAAAFSEYDALRRNLRDHE
jgi:hypothetical protein